MVLQYLFSDLWCFGFLTTYESVLVQFLRVVWPLLSAARLAHSFSDSFCKKGSTSFVSYLLSHIFCLTAFLFLFLLSRGTATWWTCSWRRSATKTQQIT